MTAMSFYTMQNCLASDYQHQQTLMANLSAERQNWINNNHASLYDAINNGNYHPSLGQPQYSPVGLQ